MLADQDYPVANVRDYGSSEALSQVFPNWVYVGRRNGVWEQSPLANRFKIGRNGSRAKVIQSYRGWLWKKIKAGDAEVLTALEQINRKTVLVCWCAPEPCHGDVIHKAAAWLRENG